MKKNTILPQFKQNFDNILLYPITIRYSFISYALLNIVNMKTAINMRYKTMSKTKGIEDFLFIETNNNPQINRLAFQYADGGMEQAGFKKSSDCVVRAICNATSLSYRKVLDDLNKLTEEFRLNSNSRLAKKMKPKQNVRQGAYKKVYHNYILSLGWVWKPTMKIGQGCKVHLRRNELPEDKSLIVRVSKHLTCVKNDCIYDTYDCSREGTRCVYGYYFNPKYYPNRSIN